MWSENIPKEKLLYEKIINFGLSSVLMFTSYSISATNEEMFKKIDLFGEVLEKIKEEYVDEINQAEVMDQQLMECFNHWTHILLI